jgi:hypothetical protein
MTRRSIYHRVAVLFVQLNETAFLEAARCVTGFLN